MIFLALGQAAQIFSVWWIGASRDSLRSLSTGLIIGIYTSLVSFYGFVLLVTGLMVPFYAAKVAEKIATEVVESFKMVDHDWLEKENRGYSLSLIGKVRCG